MAIVAFLSSAVSPVVAAAAANSALQVIMGKGKDLEKEKDKEKEKEKEKEEKSGEGVTKMEVDTPNAGAVENGDSGDKDGITKQTIKAASVAAIAAAVAKAEVLTYYPSLFIFIIFTFHSISPLNLTPPRIRAAQKNSQRDFSI